jgi:hypothetical protein
VQLLLDLRPKPDRLLTRLDLGLAADRVRLALRVGDQLLTHAPGGSEPRAGSETDCGERKRRADDDSDDYPNDNEHGCSCPSAAPR